MAKRGLNIYKRKDGRWEGRYKNGYTANGKIRYSSIYGKSYSTVKEQLESKRAESHNISSCSCKCTVGELIEMWLSDIKNKVKDSTLANYTMKLQKHILPYFSGFKYDKLTADNLNTFISKKVSENLSEKYVSDIVTLLRSVAKFAQRRYGYANRLDSVTLPKSKKRSEQRLLSDSEQVQLKHLLINQRNNTHTGILLSATTGIRIGELCALKWQDIDLEKSIITVKQTVQRISNNTGNGTHLIVASPKSATSVREIPLPDFIIPILKDMKKQGDCYLLSGSNKVVEPRTMQYRFKSMLKRAGLPYVNFHSLRHMFATNCISLGFDVKTLSEILGHSSVQVTLNRYVHSSMERKKSCMKLISESYTA